MGLEVYSIEQSTQWDKIVCSFEQYDTYWLSGYVKAFQIHGDGTPLLFYYSDAATRGIAVAMKRDIGESFPFTDHVTKGELFDLSSVYGYGGWLIEGNQKEELFSAYEDWCKRSGIVCEFVRFHPVIENHKYCMDAYDITQLGQTIAMDISSPDIIWQNLTSKNRNMIRKAAKNKVVVYNARNPEIFKHFKEIYDRTMDKDHAEGYYYFNDAFYTSILEDLPFNSQVFYAEYDGKIIAASIIVFANEKMNYHLSGSVKEYSNLAPTNLILYQAALWGCMNGYKTLYLGGGVGSDEDNLFKFKRAFYRKNDLKHFYIGKKIFLHETYDKLVKIRTDILQPNLYFPAYRLSSDCNKKEGQTHAVSKV